MKLRKTDADGAPWRAARLPSTTAIRPPSCGAAFPWPLPPKTQRAGSRSPRQPGRRTRPVPYQGRQLLSAIEEAAPGRLRAAQRLCAFTFGEGGTTALSFVDQPITLTISKVDIVGGAEIAGATLHHRRCRRRPSGGRMDDGGRRRRHRAAARSDPYPPAESRPHLHVNRADRPGRLHPRRERAVCHR